MKRPHQEECSEHQLFTDHDLVCCVAECLVHSVGCQTHIRKDLEKEAEDAVKRQPRSEKWDNTFICSLHSVNSFSWKFKGNSQLLKQHKYTRIDSFTALLNLMFPVLSDPPARQLNKFTVFYVFHETSLNHLRKTLPFILVSQTSRNFQEVWFKVEFRKAWIIVS